MASPSLISRSSIEVCLSDRSPSIQSKYTPLITLGIRCTKGLDKKRNSTEQRLPVPLSIKPWIPGLGRTCGAFFVRTSVLPSNFHPRRVADWCLLSRVLRLRHSGGIYVRRMQSDKGLRAQSLSRSDPKNLSAVVWPIVAAPTVVGRDGEERDGERFLQRHFPQWRPRWLNQRQGRGTLFVSSSAHWGNKEWTKDCLPQPRRERFNCF